MFFFSKNYNEHNIEAGGHVPILTLEGMILSTDWHVPSLVANPIMANGSADIFKKKAKMT